MDANDGLRLFSGATAEHIFNVPAELQLAMLAAVRFANQVSLGQKGSKIRSLPIEPRLQRFSMKICRRVANT